jgi:predicted ATPase
VKVLAGTAGPQLLHAWPRTVQVLRIAVASSGLWLAVWLQQLRAMSNCGCTGVHAPIRVVLTGGPGAGKTAVLEVVRRAMCHHVHVLPEAAGIVFGGGFPRGTAAELRRPAQRAIFHVQRELEATALARDHALVVCDRGTVDGLAYWPGPEDMFVSVGSSLGEELERYHAVIHLQTPPFWEGYNHDNPLRIETAAEAAAIDAKIALAWARHPRRFEVAASVDFLSKAAHALAIVRDQLPACCRSPAIRA